MAGRPRPRRQGWHRRTRLPLIAWSAQARGWLAGRYPTPERCDPDVRRVSFCGDNLERLARARELAARRGRTAVQVALAYVLQQPFPVTALVGPESLAELEESMGALDLAPCDGELRSLVLTAPAPGGGAQRGAVPCRSPAARPRRELRERMRFFATTIPGLGEILRREITALGRATSIGPVLADRRADIVRFAQRGAFGKSWPETGETLCVEIAAAVPIRELAQTLRRLWREADVERALSVYTGNVRPLRRRMSYRVAVRLRSEARFRRGQLRDALIRHIQLERPRWQLADERADLEFWVMEAPAGRLLFGLRLAGRRGERRPAARRIEVGGALRPAVAAGMLLLAGEGAGGALLDPCCGSGTILAAAKRRDWRAVGSDLSPRALGATAANLRGETLLCRADVRRLPFTAGALSAVVTNLPFGRRYRLGQSARDFYSAALDECARVARAGAPVIWLGPAAGLFFDAACAGSRIRVSERFRLGLLGVEAALFAGRRV